MTPDLDMKTVTSSAPHIYDSEVLATKLRTTMKESGGRSKGVGHEMCFTHKLLQL